MGVTSKNDNNKSELSSYYEIIQRKVVQLTHLGHKQDIALTNLSNELELKTSDQKLLRAIMEYNEISDQHRQVINDLKTKLEEDPRIQWPSLNT